MEFRQTMYSDELNSVLNLPPFLRNMRVDIVVMPSKETSNAETKAMRKFDFAQGPELPDTFFDPLPEEELKAWGL